MLAIPSPRVDGGCDPKRIPVILSDTETASQLNAKGSSPPSLRGADFRSLLLAAMSTPLSIWLNKTGDGGASAMATWAAEALTLNSDSLNRRFTMAQQSLKLLGALDRRTAAKSLWAGPVEISPEPCTQLHGPAGDGS